MLSGCWGLFWYEGTVGQTTWICWCLKVLRDSLPSGGAACRLQQMRVVTGAEIQPSWCCAAGQGAGSVLGGFLG